ncbi:MAG: cytochrome C [Geobacteraceae bacterium GWC2_58_44]|nr:MAG: cytochrome C [Geobacteraceae bacterium GWC2_58_44]HBG05981.1 cytochrome C [Geobacter sp.]
MKKLVVTMLLVATAAGTAHAGLKVIGKGDAMRLDPSSFPPVMKENYEVVRVKCIKCHTLERTIVAIQTGVAPISGQPFDRSATKAYGVKMLRKPDSNMSKPEVKASVDLMNFLLAEAER